uniref:Uncharacterized protein n=1 Tax=Anguilla anguilla TaxID=7936 RepID=A0A0E9TIJ9_ANGAN
MFYSVLIFSCTKAVKGLSSGFLPIIPLPALLRFTSRSALSPGLAQRRSKEALSLPIIFVI